MPLAPLKVQSGSAAACGRGAWLQCRAAALHALPASLLSLRSVAKHCMCSGLLGADTGWGVGGNGKDIFGDAWWLNTDGEAFPAHGLGAGSEASWPVRRAGSVSTLSIASGLTGITEDFRYGYIIMVCLCSF